MTITLDTPMVGPVDTTPALLIPAFSGHAYDDATVATFAAALVKWAGVFGIRASILTGQIAKETGFFQFGGQVHPSQFNMAGLGATNGGASGASYPDIDTGVCAVCVHWMAYIYGDVAQWPTGVRQYQHLDERYAAVLSTGHAGKITTLGTVTNGVWAYSPQYPIGSLDNGYATGIVAIANSIGASHVATYPSAADIGAPVRIETTDFVGPDRALADIKWFVVHDTEGHYEGDISVLTHGSRNGSIHAIIGREPGQFCVSVPITTTAWAAGNDTLGALAVQVELSKSPQSGEVGYTDTQYAYLAAFFRWCVAQGMTGVGTKYYWPHPPDADGGPLPDVPGIIGHYGVPNPNKPGQWGGFAGHTDPGNDFDWPRFIALLGNTPPTPTPGPPPDLRVFPETGKGIFGNIKGYFEQFNDDAVSLAVFGLPVTDLVYEGGLPVQYFERAALEDHAGNVMGRRLGAAAAAAAGHTGPGI